MSLNEDDEEFVLKAIRLVCKVAGEGIIIDDMDAEDFLFDYVEAKGSYGDIPYDFMKIFKEENYL